LLIFVGPSGPNTDIMSPFFAKNSNMMYDDIINISGDCLKKSKFQLVGIVTSMIILILPLLIMNVRKDIVLIPKYFL